MTSVHELVIHSLVHSIYVYYKNNFNRVDSLTLARDRNVAEQQASSKLEFEACGIFAARTIHDDTKLPIPAACS